jgi:hypothetical protein
MNFSKRKKQDKSTTSYSTGKQKAIELLALVGLFLIGGFMGAIFGFWLWVQLHSFTFFHSWVWGAFFICGASLVGGILVLRLMKP